MTQTVATPIQDSSQTSQPNCLRITEEQFNTFYPDLVGYYEHFNNPPPAGISKEYFEKYYLSSKLWRLNNLYTVVNKEGAEVTFRMNLAQHVVYSATRKHPRCIILKSRQQGISTFWLVSFFDDAAFGKTLSIGLMAQGTDEASTLLERVKILWNHLDDDVKNFLGISITKDNTKEFGFSNGCTMFIRVSFRSTTLQRLHISEFGKIANANPQRAKETKTGTLQALGKGNAGIIESTAEGKNDFKLMWDNAVIAEQSGQMTWKDFYPVFLSWLDDPDCHLDVPQVSDNEADIYFSELEEKTGRPVVQTQRNFWLAQRRELEGDIYQEYPGTPEEAFAASRDGTYYSRLFNEKCVRKRGLVTDLYDPNLDLDIYFDLGVDDYFVMAGVQWYRGEYRIVKEYWNNGYDLEHYIDEADTWGWEVRELVFPHDIKVRQLASGRNGGGRARTRQDILQDYLKDAKRTGQLPNVAHAHVRRLAKSSIADGIESVRRMIPLMKIDPKCTYLIDCLNNYSKEWDPKLQVWKLTPLHDEYSHGADLLRQVAVGHRETGDSKRAIPEKYSSHSGHAV